LLRTLDTEAGGNRRGYPRGRVELKTQRGTDKAEIPTTEIDGTERDLEHPKGEEGNQNRQREDSADTGGGGGQGTEETSNLRKVEGDAAQMNRKEKG